MPYKRPYKELGVILKVVSWVPYQHHVCEDEDGKKHNVDLYVGCNEDLPLKGFDMVGAVVECEWLQVYLELANNTKIIKKPDAV